MCSNLLYSQICLYCFLYNCRSLLQSLSTCHSRNFKKNRLWSGSDLVFMQKMRNCCSKILVEALIVNNNFYEYLSVSHFLLIGAFKPAHWDTFHFHFLHFLSAIITTQMLSTRLNCLIKRNCCYANFANTWKVLRNYFCFSSQLHLIIRAFLFK